SGLFPWWPERELTRSHYATIEERQILSAKTLNSARVDITHPAESGAAYGSPVVNNGVASAGTYSTPGIHSLQFFGVAEGRHDGIVSVGSGVNQLGPAGALPFYLVESRFGVADDVVWTSGAHSVKAGAMATRFRDNTWAPQREMTWNFGSLS